MNLSRGEITFKQRLGWLINIIMHQIMAVTIMVMIWKYIVDPEVKNIWWWHKVLLILSYILFMFQGVVMFHKNSVLTVGMNRKQIAMVHTYTMATAFVFMFVGILLAIIGKFQNGHPHFESMHAKIGFSSGVICTAAVIMGAMVNYQHIFKRYVKPLFLKYGHVLLGLAGYVLGVVAILLKTVKGTESFQITNNWFVGINLVISTPFVFLTLFSQIRAIFGH